MNYQNFLFYSEEILICFYLFFEELPHFLKADCKDKMK